MEQTTGVCTNRPSSAVKAAGSLSLLLVLLESLSANVLGSITEQSRPLGTTVLVGITNSLQAAALFLTISRHLSYANLPNNPFCAIIVVVVDGVMLLMFHCVAACS